MPTHFETPRFLREWARLPPEQQRRFRASLGHFIEDLPARSFRAGLRVKRLQISRDVYEMSFGPNGRALWEYGDEVIPGEPHVIWLRIGTHEIFE